MPSRIYLIFGITPLMLDLKVKQTNITSTFSTLVLQYQRSRSKAKYKKKFIQN